MLVYNIVDIQGTIEMCLIWRTGCTIKVQTNAKNMKWKRKKKGQCMQMFLFERLKCNCKSIQLFAIYRETILVHVVFYSFLKRHITNASLIIMFIIDSYNFSFLDQIRDPKSDHNLIQGYPDPTFGVHSSSKTIEQLSLERMRTNMNNFMRQEKHGFR